MPTMPTTDAPTMPPVCNPERDQEPPRPPEFLRKDDIVEPERRLASAPVPDAGKTPVTRSEMQAFLEPLHTCLFRVEKTLEQLSLASLSAEKENATKRTLMLGEAAVVNLDVSVQEQEQSLPNSAAKPASMENTNSTIALELPVGNSEAGQEGQVSFASVDQVHPISGDNTVMNGPPTGEKRPLRHQNSNVHTQDVSVLRLAEHVTINHALKAMEAGVLETGDALRSSYVDRVVMQLDTFFRWWDSIQEPNRTGCIYRFVASQCFENTCMLAITFNSALVAFAADWEIRHVGEDQPDYLVQFEHAFLMYFVIELILRLLAHRCFFFLNKEMHWNMFDFTLVTISLVDFLVEKVVQTQKGGSSNVAFMRMLRLLKLARIFRAMRSFRFFKSLAILLESFEKSFISLFWGFVMLGFVLYLFALIIMQALVEYMKVNEDLSSTDRSYIMDKFGSLGATLISLYMSVTGGEDWGPYYYLMCDVGSAYGLVFIFFSFIFLFALFNILTGSIVEKAMASSKPDRADMILNQRKLIAEQKKEFMEICHVMDKNGDGKISFEEFENWTSNPVMLAYMASIGLEMQDVEIFFQTVGSQIGSDGIFDLAGAEVEIEQFAEGCMHMKGGATALDMQRQLYEMKSMQHDLKMLTQKLNQTSQQVQQNTRQSFIPCKGRPQVASLAPVQSQRKPELKEAL